MNEEVKQTLEAVKECLEDARAMLGLSRFKATVSRSYYPMFHSAKAALLFIQVETHTHHGANMQFGKHFIKTGIFDKRLIRTFSKMLDTRQKAVYEIGFRASKEDAAHAYQEASNFYGIILNYIS